MYVGTARKRLSGYGDGAGGTGVHSAGARRGPPSRHHHHHHTVICTATCLLSVPSHHHMQSQHPACSRVLNPSPQARASLQGALVLLSDLQAELSAAQRMATSLDCIDSQDNAEQRGSPAVAAAPRSPVTSAASPSTATTASPGTVRLREELRVLTAQATIEGQRTRLLREVVTDLTAFQEDLQEVRPHSSSLDSVS